MSKKRKFHIFSWSFFIFLFFKAFRSIDLIFWGFLFSLCSSIVFCTCCANRYSDFVQNLDLTAEVITKLSFDIREYFLDSFHFDSQLMSANLKMSVYHCSYSFIRRFTVNRSPLEKIDLHYHTKKDHDHACQILKYGLLNNASKKLDQLSIVILG